MAAHEVPTAGPAHRRGLVLLYDGDCALCNGTVQWLLRHDAHGNLQFAMLQGEHGRAVRVRFPDAATLDSVVLVEGAGDATRMWARSDVVIRLARYLGPPWSLLAAGALVPRPWRDALYDLVARHRYHWVGHAVACRVLAASERRRFLD